MKQFVTGFLNTDAGKGTLGVILCCLIFAFPRALDWLVAAVTLHFAIRHFRESFRKLDAENARKQCDADDAATIVLDTPAALPLRRKAVFARVSVLADPSRS
jgi:hypothetical protein